MDRNSIFAGERIVNPNGSPALGFMQKFNGRQRRCLVAELPTDVPAGEQAYATNLCVFNGAGTQETTTNGTGGLVTFNGTNWVIAGTNVTASA